MCKHALLQSYWSNFCCSIASAISQSMVTSMIVCVCVCARARVDIIYIYTDIASAISQSMVTSIIVCVCVSPSLSLCVFVCEC